MTPCTCHPGNVCASAASCAAARRVEFGESMTTTPAMPELPEHAGFIDIGPVARRAYTADQMDARYLQGYNDALATLQSQPAAAGVSDAEINRLACLAGFSPVLVATDNGAFGRFARAILALRPQAVPMTDEQLCAALGIDGSDEWTYKVRDVVEAYHRITAQGAQGGEG